MDVKRCVLVVGATIVALIVASAIGIFVPSALLPRRFLEGGTRAIVSAALVLVSAMVIATTCRAALENRPAKSQQASRKKTSR